MTPAARRTYAKQYFRWHRQQERIATRIVLARMSGILNGVLTAINRSNPELARDMLPILVTDEAHRSMLEAIYIPVGVEAARKQYARLLPTKAAPVMMLTKDRDKPSPTGEPQKPRGVITIDYNSEKWRQTMVALARDAETASRVKGMAERTRTLIRETITKGAEERWSISKLARTLRDVVVSKARAVLIARTETTRAANAGHEAGAASTLLKLDKVWIATLDSRTRESHVAASKQKVAKDGFFLVSGLKMKYPGDPAGGIAETAQCRCVVSYVPAGVNFD